LLAKGFYIVTGPVPYDVGPIPAQWDATYQYLTGHGFSQKPVMEGAGSAAGQAFAWALANPDKVACIYSVNPIMHSNLAKMPLIENLDILAKAGVPLLNVSGSLDPNLNQSQTIENEYKKSGGNTKVIVNEDQKHSDSIQNPAPIADFIVQSVNR
jgi:hypothetical protein